MNKESSELTNSEALLPIDSEERKSLFSDISMRYEQYGVIVDSIVRKDQEDQIAQTIQNKPVIVRGASRIGKTSMCYGLECDYFGEDRSIMIGYVYTEESETLENFKTRFGRMEVAEMLTNLSEETNRRDNEEEIFKSGKTPFEYLNDCLEERGESVYLAVDEVVGLLKKNPDKLRHIANLKNLKNIKLALVVHQMADEASIKDIFEGFEEFYIRSLSRDEVADLVRHPLKNSPVQFSEGAIDRIFEVTGGRPMEVNNICQNIMFPYTKGSVQKAIYEVEDINNFIDRGLFVLSESGLDVAIRTYQETFQYRLSESQQNLTIKLLNEGQLMPSDETKEDMRVLEDLMIARQQEDGSFALNGGLFKRVLKEKILGKDSNPIENY